MQSVAAGGESHGCSVSPAAVSDAVLCGVRSEERFTCARSAGGVPGECIGEMESDDSRCTHAAPLAASVDWARSDNARSAARGCLIRMIRLCEKQGRYTEGVRHITPATPVAVGCLNRPSSCLVGSQGSFGNAVRFSPTAVVAKPRRSHAGVILADLLPLLLF